METVDRKIEELIPSEYNPRQMTGKQNEDLKASLKRFGVVEPILVNMHDDRKNIIIGGHQRLRVWKDLGNKTIPCVETKVNRGRERELSIRLNKNTGEFDWDALANEFDIGELEEWGFDDNDFNLDKIPFKPEDDPGISDHKMNEDEMKEIANKMNDKLKEGQKLQEVICPQCGEEFYVK